ncbi:MAG: putative RNA-binding Zn-ribbon protein involved in translation (DUF1610 family) [Phycisphaerales bacterium]
MPLGPNPYNPHMTEHSPPYLCPACGYEINPADSSSPFACPECGRETEARHASESAHRASAARWQRRVTLGLLLPPIALTMVELASVVSSDSRTTEPMLAMIAFWAMVAWAGLAPLVVCLAWTRLPKPVRLRLSLWVLSAWYALGLCVFGGGVVIWIFLGMTHFV